MSKWQLLLAAADAGTAVSYVGIGALLISALLTAIYMFTVVSRAWFPGRDRDLSGIAGVREADWRMSLPHLILAAGCLVFGCWTGPVLDAAARIAGLG